MVFGAISTFSSELDAIIPMRLKPRRIRRRNEIRTPKQEPKKALKNSFIALIFLVV
jgi:hypothetical protein